MAFVLGIVAIVVGLGVSIALHEIGHLVPAKRFGVRVGQYMIGFGPTLFSRRRGETEYGVKLLPLGGYISMAGMYPRSTAALAPDGSVAEPAAAAEDAGSTRPEARSGRMFRAMIQDARAANDETLEGADDSRAFFALSTWKRVVIMAGGPLMNLVIAIVLFTILASGVGIQATTTTVAGVSECVVPAGSSQTVCGDDDPEAPAAEAGILPGDRIVSVDGQPVDTFDQVSLVIQGAPGRSIPVVVERDGEELSLSMTPLLTERPVYDAQGYAVLDDDGQPLLQDVGFAGVTAATERQRQPIWSGPETAFAQTGAVVGIVAQLPVKLYETAVALFTGGERDPDGPISVVGVGALAGEVAASEAPILDRVTFVVGLLAAVNIALFVFNLIPLLPLDGGHIAIALWDALRRGWARVRGKPAPRPTDATKLVPGTFVVVVLMIAMFVLLVAADVFNPLQILG